MLDKPKPYTMLTDFVTGKEVPNIGAEENRQRIERLLVEEKGYDTGDIEVDADLTFKIKDQVVHSHVDLVVGIDDKRFMVLRCVPGSLGTRHRETLAAARLLYTYQIPLSVITDGTDADVLDTLTGEPIGHGIDAIPSKDEGRKTMRNIELKPFPQEKLEREGLIFRSYDELNINVQRKLKVG
ncbi:MAG: type I restriction enzyme HsdR N-terminal domain-containing protein [Thermodesulfobacteriota bacterium]|nr:type I restriction enzyme HsdR N-terminal domain-containing protein [Thermodesulfobacteriota bacterium]